MATLVTDPELLRQLNAQDVTAAPAPDAAPGAMSAPPAGMTRVTDPDLLRILNATDSPPQEPTVGGVRFRTDGSPADIVNKPTAPNDPIYHGAVPVNQAPADPGAVTAFASGVQGAPIVGPSISGSVEAAAAAGRALREGTSYADERQRVHEMVDLARSQHPGAAFAGDLTGAASATAPLIAFAPEAFGAGGGGLTLGRLATGAATGADIGALDAAARSGADPSAIRLGTIGGAIGGGASPLFTAGVSRAAGGAADYLARITGGNVPGLSREAAGTIMRALENDGALSPQGVARLQEAGPQGMLADAGPATAGALDTALARGGSGSTTARAAIEQRAADSSRDLSTTLDRSLGPAPGLQTAGDAIRDGSAAARRAAYDAAYAAPIDYTTQAGRALEDMVANRVPPGIIARANNQMRIDGVQSRQMILRQQPDGSYTLGHLPDVRQIDYITRSLNDVARAGDGQGALGGNTAEGRSYGMLARELRDTLRRAVPEYGHALETAAQPIQARNALEFGSEILSPRIARDVAADRIGEMTGPELTQARVGLRSAIAETMANVKRTMSDPNTDARAAMDLVRNLSSDAAREKMSLLVPQQEAAAMNTALTRATRALELRAAMATNSRTFGRTATDAAVKEATAPGMVGTLLEGKPIDAPRAGLQYITGRRPVDYARRQDALYGEIASALTEPRGAQAQTMLQRLFDLADRRQGFQSIAGGIPFGALTQTGSLALLPALNQPRAQ